MIISCIQYTHISKDDNYFRISMELQFCYNFNSVRYRHTTGVVTQISEQIQSSYTQSTLIRIEFIHDDDIKLLLLTWTHSSSNLFLNIHIFVQHQSLISGQSINRSIKLAFHSIITPLRHFDPNCIKSHAKSIQTNLYYD